MVTASWTLSSEVTSLCRRGKEGSERLFSLLGVAQLVSTLGSLWNLVLTQLVLKDRGECCSLHQPVPSSLIRTLLIHLVFTSACGIPG